MSEKDDNYHYEQNSYRWKKQSLPISVSFPFCSPYISNDNQQQQQQHHHHLCHYYNYSFHHRKRKLSLSNGYLQYGWNNNTNNVQSIQKTQSTSSSAWLPVLSSKVPEPRPGTCVNDTQVLPDSVLNFIRGHPLMDSAVEHDNGRPIFYKRDLIFTRIVIDRLEVDGLQYTVYFAATNTGLVYKIIEWYDQSGQVHTNLVDIIEATNSEPIRAIEISSRHKSLYVASDSGIKQIDLFWCKNHYESCTRCIQDPYCGWDPDQNECKPYTIGLVSFSHLFHLIIIIIHIGYAFAIYIHFILFHYHSF